MQVFYLKHFEEDTDFDDLDNEVPSDFIEKLNRGGLRVPTLNLVYLVHSPIELYDKIIESRKSCTKYFRLLLSFIYTPYSRNVNICKRLTNIIFKAEVLHKSDKENQLGCLRRKENLNTILINFLHSHLICVICVNKIMNR